MNILIDGNSLTMSRTVVEESTVTERYVPSARGSGSEIRSLREAMAGRFNLSLKAVSKWGLVRFIEAKAHACLFSVNRSQFQSAPPFRGVTVPIRLNWLPISWES